MGLFSRKDKNGSVSTAGTRKNSASIAEHQSISSQSSLKSPQTPGFSKMSLPALPKIALPKGPNPNVDPAGYLRSIGAVRERCSLVMDPARKNQLTHFNVDMSKFEDTTKFVVSIIKVREQNAEVTLSLSWRQH
jgi:hypothetical protein